MQQACGGFCFETTHAEGRTVLFEVLNMDSSQVIHMAVQVKVISNSTTLIADAANKEEISMRVKQIKKELSETDSVYDTEKLSERIAKLAGGVAVIKVCYILLAVISLAGR